jgi:hypothetical protein
MGKCNPIVKKSLIANSYFSESEWTRHKEGKEPVTAQIIDMDDTVRFICFAKLQQSGLNHILDHLDGKIHPVITRDPRKNMFNLWIFTTPVSAETAKSTAKTILKEIQDQIGIRVDCQVLPRYASKKSMLANKNKTFENDPNEIRLPLYSGELVLRDDKFTNDIEGMQISVYDLAGIEPHPEFMSAGKDAITAAIW